MPAPSSLQAPLQGLRPSGLSQHGAGASGHPPASCTRVSRDGRGCISWLSSRGGSGGVEGSPQKRHREVGPRQGAAGCVCGRSPVADATPRARASGLFPEWQARSSGVRQRTLVPAASTPGAPQPSWAGAGGPISQMRKLRPGGLQADKPQVRAPPCAQHCSPPRGGAAHRLHKPWG